MDLCFLWKRVRSRALVHIYRGGEGRAFMDGTGPGVFREVHQGSLTGLLWGANGRAPEAHVQDDVLRDVARQALEGQLEEERLRGRLPLSEFAQRQACSGEAS